MVKIRKGFDLANSLKEVSSSRTLNDDGSMTMSAFGAMDDLVSYLSTALVIDGKTTSFTQQVVQDAIRSKQELSVSGFVETAKKKVIELEAKRVDLRVVFPLWRCDGVLEGKRKCGGVWVNFSPNESSSFVRRARNERNEQASDIGAERNLARFADLPIAVASVKAISSADAFQQAESGISVEMGLLSALVLRGKSIIPENPKRPLSYCLLAPHMTVHRKSGSIKNDIFWYNDWPEDHPHSTRSKEQKSKNKAALEIYRKRLSKLPWRSHAEEALAKHYEAFSHADSEASFLAGWRVLEFIGGPNYTKSDRLVDRASSFFERLDYQRDIGKHLLFRRNSVSHGKAIDAGDNQTLAFQMHNFVSPFFRHYLSNPFKFRSLDELWEFCDIEASRVSRLRKIHILNCAAKFRNEPDYPS